jgi:hypothetical protein
MSVEEANYFNDPRVAAARSEPGYIKLDESRMLLVIGTRTADWHWLNDNDYDPEEFIGGVKPLEYSERVDDGPCWSCDGVGKAWKGFGPGVVDKNGTRIATKTHHTYPCASCHGSKRRTKLVDLEQPRVPEGAEDRPYHPFRYLALPCVMVDCPTCRGTGSHVNPSIDCGGISSEQFDRDPDFEDAYFSGAYDVTCYGCNGRKQQPEVHVEALCAEDRAAYETWSKWQDELAEEEWAYEAERAAEIRMGC